MIRTHKNFIFSLLVHILLVLGVYASSVFFTLPKYDIDVSSVISVSLIDQGVLQTNKTKPSPIVKTHKNPNNDVIAEEGIANIKQYDHAHNAAVHPIINYEDVVKNGANAKPVYPLIAKINRWEGVVTLKITIDEVGNVEHLEIINSSGHKVLDDAAISGVKRWQLKNHSKKKASVIVPINFKLR